MKKTLLMLPALLLLAGLSQAQTTEVVRAGDLSNDYITAYTTPSWFFYNDENEAIDNTLGSFVAGPAVAPAGAGSAMMSVTGTQRRNIATYQYKGTALKNITALGFSTYNPSAGNGGGANRSAYLHFDVNFKKGSFFPEGGRLIFEPRSNGTVVQDTWQDWDALDGGNALWAWSKYSSNGNKWPDGNTSRLRTWSSILAAFPSIAVDDRALFSRPGFMGLRVGEPYNSGYTDYVDAFIFGTANGTTTFDFEPDSVPVDCQDPATAPSYAGGFVTNAAGTQAYIQIDVPAGGTLFEFYNTTNLVVEGVNSAPEAGTGLAAFTDGTGMKYSFGTPSPSTVYFPIRTATSSTSVRFFLKVTDTCGRTVDVDPEFALNSASEQIAGAGLVAYPNPAAGPATIRFSMEQAGQVRLAVYDVLGREMAVVANADFGAGDQSVSLDASSLSSGLYVIRLEAGGRVLTQTFTVAR